MANTGAVRALRIIRAYRAVSLASVGLMRQVSMIVFSISRYINIRVPLLCHSLLF